MPKKSKIKKSKPAESTGLRGTDERNKIRKNETLESKAGSRNFRQNGTPENKHQKNKSQENKPQKNREVKKRPRGFVLEIFVVFLIFFVLLNIFHRHDTDETAVKESPAAENNISRKDLPATPGATDKSTGNPNKGKSLNNGKSSSENKDKDVKSEDPGDGSGTDLKGPYVNSVNEDDLYFSYLQGPRSWKERLPWSGKWGVTFYDGRSFGGFGCGLCCLANIYSTMSDYVCTPVDMYNFVKDSTGYYGGGAVEWKYMKDAAVNCGFEAETAKKPDRFRNFKRAVKHSEATVALVSSYDHDGYWKNTGGHYVTLFGFDKSTKTVFLADSGDPDHNRQRVKLKVVYKSLKSSSIYQYMTVKNYSEERDTFKCKKMTGRWIEPVIAY